MKLEKSEFPVYIKSIVDTILDGIVTIDEHCTIHTFNPAAERIFGYSATEAIGQNVRFLMPEPYSSEHDSYMQNYLRTGVAKIIGIGREVQGLRKDGSPFHMELSISEMDLGGKRFFTGVVRDITERKRAELKTQTALLAVKDSENRLRAVLDTILDGIVTIDEHCTIHTFNPAAERIFGYSATEAIGQNVRFLMPEPYRTEHDGYMQNYLKTGVAKIIGIGREVQGLRKDGSTFHLELSISEMDLGGKRFFAGILRDITERKHAEQALEKANIEALSANRAKSEFLANMSHEIRTPMNAILGYAQILGRDDNISQQQQETLRKILKGGDHLLALINDILDISKIEAGKMVLNLADFSLDKLIADLSAMFQSRCLNKDLTWHLEGAPSEQTPVHGDETKIRQVLINIIGNAVKFTDAGSVTLKLSQPQPQHYHFEIIDTGVGIANESQNAIFEPFKQDKAGFVKGGTGLGLAISQRQLVLMGSRLQVESKLGQGSKFHFTLRLPNAQTTQVKKEEPIKEISGLAPGAQLLAVVADDVDENRDILSRILKKIGVDVVQCVNGEEAVERTLKHRPQIVFMDMRMPVLNGLDATRKIRETCASEQIKIIAITASVLEHQRKLTEDAGCDGFIPKPFRIAEVHDCLETLFPTLFTYSNVTAGPKATVSFNLADLSRMKPLPQALVDALRQSTELYNVTEINKVIEAIEARDIEGKQIAMHLKALARKYDMDGILAVADALGGNAPSQP
jgi:two-component system sensor histidine kinase EvgS